jgi:hypothetical protein
VLRILALDEFDAIAALLFFAVLRLGALIVSVLVFCRPRLTPVPSLVVFVLRFRVPLELGTVLFTTIE